MFYGLPFLRKPAIATYQTLIQVDYHRFDINSYD